MIPRLLALTILALGTAMALAFGLREPAKEIVPDNRKATFRMGCSPDWEQVNALLEEVDIPPIEGAGKHSWKISTTDDSAQFYFNQGMNMYYGFHIIEAMASFRKAANFDPESPMLHWAQALAYGPNINDVGYTASPEALAAAGRAVELIDAASPVEQLLIRAQRARYSGDSSASRDSLNQVYVDMMKAIFDKYPSDGDAAALYADAMMLQHPWDLWKNDGTPRPWTPRIREVLEKILVRHPDHPGANHYYIHLMEPSPFADKARASADKLGRLTPALSHMVHMPSHIYLRTGEYEKGVSVNKTAVASYNRMIPLFSPVTGNDFLYLIHNLHMQANNAMLLGNSAEAVQAAEETYKSVPEEYLASPGGLGNFIQYVRMTPVLVDIRFSRWAELLAMEAPDASLTYSTILYHFGRGMALANLSRTDEARLDLAIMKTRMKDTVLLSPFTPFSPAIEGSRVASHLLEGSIAMAEGDFDRAAAAFRLASEIEEKMVYTEPRDWMLNPKHFLGEALLRAGKFAAAEKVFRKDLLNNNENGWSLHGLYKSLAGQKKQAESQAVLKRFKKSWMKSDVTLPN